MDNCPKKDCHEKNALVFRKVIIPASVADDSVNPPKNGDYCNTLVEYKATGNIYLFSSDGSWVMLSANSVEMMKALDREIDERKEADTEIWNEIETIEAASDVVDVVGTYAELQQYDTSKLNDNDLIKVLTDETHDDAISYYRWNETTQAFTYVGSEGPYYTASEVDTLLAGKQDTLIAGTNISIASDGKTISATDTTYNAFTGATASVAGTSGLVPAPSAGDEGKVLMGNGTWGEGAANTIFYRNSSETGSTRHLYKSPDMTGIVSMQDILDANEKGQVIVRLSTSATPENYSDSYLQNAYVGPNDYQMLFLNEKAYESYDTTQPTDTAFLFSRRELQDKLTAGTNVQINGNTISATDTTYTHFTGATALADGTQGLVPGPLAGDQDKFLKADGTWATVQGGGSQTVVIYRKYDYQTYTFEGFYRDENFTTAIWGQDLYDLFQTSRVIVKYATGVGEPYGLMMTADPGDGGQYFFNVSYSDNDNLDTDSIFYRYEIPGTTPGPSDTPKEILLSWQEPMHAGANISIGTVSGVPYTISVTGMPVLYGSQGQNTDGAVTQKLFTDTVGNIESILQTLNSGSGV